MSIDPKMLPERYQAQIRAQDAARTRAGVKPADTGAAAKASPRAELTGGGAVLAQRPVRFVIHNQLPSGKNAVRITRTGHRYPAKRFSDWKKDAIGQIDAQLPRPEGGRPYFYFIDPVVATVAYYAGDKRRRDVPGMIDALWHIMECIQIVDDDAQIQDVIFTTGYDKQNPRAEITIARKRT